MVRIKESVLLALGTLSFLVASIYMTVSQFVHGDNTVNWFILVGFLFYAVGVIGVVFWSYLGYSDRLRSWKFHVVSWLMAILAAGGMVTFMWFIYGIPTSHMG